MSWKAQVLQKDGASTRGELCCIVVPDGTNGTELMARLYIDAYNGGIAKRVKLVCASDADLNKMFETTMQKVDKEVDAELLLFGPVDNKAVELEKAQLVLFDKALVAEAKFVQKIVDAAAEKKFTIAVVVQQSQLDSLKAFEKLHKRFVRLDSK